MSKSSSDKPNPNNFAHPDDYTRASKAIPTGVMWEVDHARPLSWKEYQHWRRNPLPFGWSIIGAPLENDDD